MLGSQDLIFKRLSTLTRSVFLQQRQHSLLLNNTPVIYTWHIDGVRHSECTYVQRNDNKVNIIMR